jgi:hypothetical protein
LLELIRAVEAVLSAMHLLFILVLATVAADDVCLDGVCSGPLRPSQLPPQVRISFGTVIIARNFGFHRRRHSHAFWFLDGV